VALLGAGYWLLVAIVTGYWLLDAVYWILNTIPTGIAKIELKGPISIL
jgi:hypothetical protein